MKKLKIEITDDSMPEWGVAIGDIFTAVQYPLDPQKVTLIEKVSGSAVLYEKESLNHYLQSAKILDVVGEYDKFSVEDAQTKLLSQILK